MFFFKQINRVRRPQHSRAGGDVRTCLDRVPLDLGTRDAVPQGAKSAQ